MMHTRLIGLFGLGLLVALAVWGCTAAPENAPANIPTNAPVVAVETGTGTLQFRANGEDFVRQGFVSKDGWDMRFDHVYVTLANLTAYQTDPPFDPDTSDALQATIQTSLDQSVTVDLAEGDEMADPLLIGEVTAPAGRYNALAWELVRATDGPASGAVLLMEGSATKDGTTLPFRISVDMASAYICGDFVGDVRKGMLEPGGTADLEATFHFDHLFGDGDAAPEDDINTSALGFAPFAALAQDGTLDVDMAALQAGLAPTDYAILTDMHLAHVGEGHCRNTYGS